MSSVVCPGGGEMFRYGQVRFLFHRSEVLAESVAEPTSSFADVTQGACTTNDDVNEVTCGTSELLSNCQRSTRGVDLSR